MAIGAMCLGAVFGISLGEETGDVRSQVRLGVLEGAGGGRSGGAAVRRAPALVAVDRDMSKEYDYLKVILKK